MISNFISSLLLQSMLTALSMFNPLSPKYLENEGFNFDRIPIQRNRLVIRGANILGVVIAAG